MDTDEHVERTDLPPSNAQITSDPGALLSKTGTDIDDFEGSEEMVQSFTIPLGA